MSNLNLHTITPAAYQAIHQLDEKLVGTKNYMGIAWFHNHEYRHYMRDISIAKRRKVHKAFIKNKLPLDGESDKHLFIIKMFT